MAQELRVSGCRPWLVGTAALLLAGCVSPPGTYADTAGPRNGDGFLVDPQTGIELPGQPDNGRR
jgi:hypothetical protein